MDTKMIHKASGKVRMIPEDQVSFKLDRGWQLVEQPVAKPKSRKKVIIDEPVVVTVDDSLQVEPTEE